jgi:hypothetical protein
VTRFVFKFGDFFPAEDAVAEWVVTLSLAYNDLVLLQEHLEKDKAIEHRWFYWLRLIIGHFREAARYLRATQRVPEIEAFVDSLPAHVRAHYDECLRLYEKNERTIERVRHEAGFHYPAMRVSPSQRRKRPIQEALEERAGGPAVVEMGAAGTVRTSRMLFADEVAAELVLKAGGGWGPLGDAQIEIEAAIGSLVRFVHLSLDEFFVRGHHRGGEWRQE